MEIVTGSTGVAHVTPIDDAVRNSNYGYYSDKVVFDIFRAFEAVAVTANEVRVYGGYGMNQGRLFKIDESEYDPVTIENGSQGVRRSDLIVARYTMDTQTGFEDISLAVIKGESGDTYTDPPYTEGAINEGATLDEFPLYRVKINGIVIDGDPEPLFEALPEGGRIGAIEKKINDHMADDENPHTLAWEESVNLESMDILDTMAVIFGKIAKAISVLISHVGNKNNPHEVKGSQLVASGANEAVPISKGGTGAVTAAGALANLGVPSDVANAASKSYVRNRLVNSVESSTTATAHHDVGDFIIYGGNDTLAKVTAEINIDDTIEDGVNVDNESVGEELTSMKATFQNGVDTIYGAIVAEGVTPSASTPSACATGIATVADNEYASGKADGKAEAESVTWTESLSIRGIVAVSGATGYIDSNPEIDIDIRNAVSINCTSIATGSGTYSYVFKNSGGSTIASGTARTGALSIPSGAQGLYIELDRGVNNPGNTGFNATANFTIVRQAKVLR